MALAPGTVAVAVVLAAVVPSTPPGPPSEPFPVPPARPSPIAEEEGTCIWLAVPVAYRNGCGRELPPSCVWLTAEPPTPDRGAEGGIRRSRWAPAPCRPSEDGRRDA